MNVLNKEELLKLRRQGLRNAQQKSELCAAHLQEFVSVDRSRHCPDWALVAARLASEYALVLAEEESARRELAWEEHAYKAAELLEEVVEPA